ncbi:hypothetical protein [Pseudomonas coronafaciens]|uniref:hypothetical protein n=1 Tax=Pseudomonas coronafaciens TaxID=53409 RepID=UPI0006B6170E|nr:hypothetical protein [Pseudomonas coronafaciens]RMT08639.1 hypothetical protein ALP55_02944 [Pseudomonas coronafaciens pv. oryzae]
MFESVAITAVLLFFLALGFFTVYAPIKTIASLIRRDNPLDRVSRFSYAMSTCLSLTAAGYAFVGAFLDSDQTDTFLWLSAYLFLQAITMAILMIKTRGRSRLDRFL